MSNDFNKCRICGLENPEPKHYYTSHKITEANYYIQYYPKLDKLTGEVITFKNRDSYLLTDFNTKNNLKKWLKSQSKANQQKYLAEILIRRRELKQWIFIPTQVELRSCPELVGIHTYDKIFSEGYYNLCKSIGYIDRGLKTLNEKSILKSTRDLKGNAILIDSREQTLLDFGRKTVEIDTLPVGDYTVKKDNHNIYIERKSLSDLTGTFGPKGFERFRKELIRTKEIGGYLILLVENDINTVLGFEHSPFYNRHTQMTAVYLFHQIRLLLQEFTCWQIAFCDGRTDMKQKILKIFEMKDYWKSYDLQLAVDLKLFKDGI